MMAEQRLKHVVYVVDSVLYFYDGELPVKEGVVTIPDGKGDWAGAAWIGGYQIDAETGEQLDWTAVTERASAGEVAKSDKKDDADEGADVGGQSVSEDGLRTSEQPRDEGDAGSGADGGDGDGPADGDAAGAGALGLDVLDALV